MKPASKNKNASLFALLRKLVLGQLLISLTSISFASDGTGTFSSGITNKSSSDQRTRFFEEKLKLQRSSSMGSLTARKDRDSFLSDGKKEPQFQKLDVEKDREGLLKGFEAEQRSGTESGGGGSQERDLFYSTLRDALAVLKREAVFHFQDGKVIEVTRLEDALRAVTIIPTKKQLYDRENVRVDLKNDSDDLVIWFNVRAWLRMSETKRIRYGLHEVLGILKISDPLYKYSAQLQKYVSQHAHIVPPTSEIQKETVSRTSVFEFLQKSKASGENVVLSTECKKYEASHEGFCMIKTVMENGQMRQLIYLIDGMLEDFQAKSVGETKIAKVRTLLNLSSDDVGFFLFLIEHEGGSSQVLNRLDCLAKGYARETDLDAGRLCVIARYPAR